MNRILILALAILAPSITVLPDAAAASLAEAKTKGVLTACVDQFNFPYSDQTVDPPGFDVDIARALAQRAGVKSELFWANTGTRGGLGRALRQSIMSGKCDLFMGVGVSSDMAEEMREKKLALTRPYLSVGFVLVTRGRAANANSLADLKGTKIGVPMATPADSYLFDNGYDRSLFLRNREILRALAKGEIEAGLVWSPALASGIKEFPEANFHMVPNFDPNLRWNVAIAVPAGAADLRSFMDETIGDMVQSGRMKEIVERYGLPYFPPS